MDSLIWMEKPSWWLKVWEYILFKVNHAPNKRFQRGQNFFNRGMIYYDCCLYNENVKEGSIKNVIDWLKKEKMITTQKTTRGMILTVLNYETYQSQKEHRKDTVNPMGRNTERIQKGHRKDTISNNVNNENNERRNKRRFEEIWLLYPNKDGKKSAMRHFLASVKTVKDWEDINKALANYLESKRVKDGYIKNGSTWFNNWRDWIDFKGIKKKSILL